MIWPNTSVHTKQNKTKNSTLEKFEGVKRKLNSQIREREKRVDQNPSV